MFHQVVVFALVVVTGAPVALARPEPPVARRSPHTTTLHGQRRVDEYFWMRERADPAVRAYLEAEDRYATQVMAPTAALQARLYEEDLGRIQETDMNVPFWRRGWFWYSRTEKGKQY